MKKIKEELIFEKEILLKEINNYRKRNIKNNIEKEKIKNKIKIIDEIINILKADFFDKRVILQSVKIYNDNVENIENNIEKINENIKLYNCKLNNLITKKILLNEEKRNKLRQKETIIIIIILLLINIINPQIIVYNGLIIFISIGNLLICKQKLKEINSMIDDIKNKIINIDDEELDYYINKIIFDIAIKKYALINQKNILDKTINDNVNSNVDNLSTNIVEKNNSRFKSKTKVKKIDKSRQ